MWNAVLSDTHRFIAHRGPYGASLRDVLWLLDDAADIGPLLPTTTDVQRPLADRYPVVNLRDAANALAPTLQSLSAEEDLAVVRLDDEQRAVRATALDIASEGFTALPVPRSARRGVFNEAEGRGGKRGSKGIRGGAARAEEVDTPESRAALDAAMFDATTLVDTEASKAAAQALGEDYDAVLSLVDQRFSARPATAPAAPLSLDNVIIVAKWPLVLRTFKIRPEVLQPDERTHVWRIVAAGMTGAHAPAARRLFGGDSQTASSIARRYMVRGVLKDQDFAVCDAVSKKVHIVSRVVAACYRPLTAYLAPVEGTADSKGKGKGKDDDGEGKREAGKMTVKSEVMDDDGPVPLEDPRQAIDDERYRVLRGTSVVSIATVAEKCRSIVDACEHKRVLLTDLLTACFLDLFTSRRFNHVGGPWAAPKLARGRIPNLLAAGGLMSTVVGARAVVEIARKGSAAVGTDDDDDDDDEESTDTGGISSDEDAHGGPALSTAFSKALTFDPYAPLWPQMARAALSRRRLRISAVRAALMHANWSQELEKQIIAAAAAITGEEEALTIVTVGARRYFVPTSSPADANFKQEEIRNEITSALSREPGQALFVSDLVKRLKKRAERLAEAQKVEDEDAETAGVEPRPRIRKTALSELRTTTDGVFTAAVRALVSTKAAVLGSCTHADHGRPVPHRVLGLGAEPLSAQRMASAVETHKEVVAATKLEKREKLSNKSRPRGKPAADRRRKAQRDLSDASSDTARSGAEDPPPKQSVRSKKDRPVDKVGPSATSTAGAKKATKTAIKKREVEGSAKPETTGGNHQEGSPVGRESGSESDGAYSSEIALFGDSESSVSKDSDSSGTIARRPERRKARAARRVRRQKTLDFLGAFESGDEDTAKSAEVIRRVGRFFQGTQARLRVNRTLNGLALTPAMQALPLLTALWRTAWRERTRTFTVYDAWQSLPLHVVCESIGVSHALIESAYAAAQRRMLTATYAQRPLSGVVHSGEAFMDREIKTLTVEDWRTCVRDLSPALREAVTPASNGVSPALGRLVHGLLTLARTFHAVSLFKAAPGGNVQISGDSVPDTDHTAQSVTLLDTVSVAGELHVLPVPAWLRMPGDAAVIGGAAPRDDAAAVALFKQQLEHIESKAREADAPNRRPRMLKPAVRQLLATIGEQSPSVRYDDVVRLARLTSVPPAHIAEAIVHHATGEHYLSSDHSHFLAKAKANDGANDSGEDLGIRSQQKRQATERRPQRRKRDPTDAADGAQGTGGAGGTVASTAAPATGQVGHAGLFSIPSGSSSSDDGDNVPVVLRARVRQSIKDAAAARALDRAARRDAARARRAARASAALFAPGADADNGDDIVSDDSTVSTVSSSSSSSSSSSASSSSSGSDEDAARPVFLRRTRLRTKLGVDALTKFVAGELATDHLFDVLPKKNSIEPVQFKIDACTATDATGRTVQVPVQRPVMSPVDPAASPFTMGQVNPADVLRSAYSSTAGSAVVPADPSKPVTLPPASVQNDVEAAVARLVATTICPAIPAIPSDSVPAQNTLVTFTSQLEDPVNTGVAPALPYAATGAEQLARDSTACIAFSAQAFFNERRARAVLGHVTARVIKRQQALMSLSGGAVVAVKKHGRRFRHLAPTVLQEWASLPYCGSDVALAVNAFATRTPCPAIDVGSGGAPAPGVRNGDVSGGVRLSSATAVTTRPVNHEQRAAVPAAAVPAEFTLDDDDAPATPSKAQPGDAALEESSPVASPTKANPPAEVMKGDGGDEDDAAPASVPDERDESTSDGPTVAAPRAASDAPSVSPPTGAAALTSPTAKPAKRSTNEGLTFEGHTGPVTRRKQTVDHREHKGRGAMATLALSPAITEVTCPEHRPVVTRGFACALGQSVFDRTVTALALPIGQSSTSAPLPCPLPPLGETPTNTGMGGTQEPPTASTTYVDQPSCWVAPTSRLTKRVKAMILPGKVADAPAPPTVTGMPAPFLPVKGAPTPPADKSGQSHDIGLRLYPFAPEEALGLVATLDTVEHMCVLFDPTPRASVAELVASFTTITSGRSPPVVIPQPDITAAWVVLQQLIAEAAPSNAAPLELPMSAVLDRVTSACTLVDVESSVEAARSRAKCALAAVLASGSASIARGDGTLLDVGSIAPPGGGVSDRVFAQPVVLCARRCPGPLEWWVVLSLQCPTVRVNGVIINVTTVDDGGLGTAVPAADELLSYVSNVKAAAEVSTEATTEAPPAAKGPVSEDATPSGSSPAAATEPRRPTSEGPLMRVCKSNKPFCAPTESVSMASMPAVGAPVPNTFAPDGSTDGRLEMFTTYGRDTRCGLERRVPRAEGRAHAALVVGSVARGIHHAVDDVRVVACAAGASLSAPGHISQSQLSSVMATVREKPTLATDDWTSENVQQGNLTEEQFTAAAQRLRALDVYPPAQAGETFWPSLLRQPDGTPSAVPLAVLVTSVYDAVAAAPGLTRTSAHRMYAGSGAVSPHLIDRILAILAAAGAVRECRALLTQDARQHARGLRTAPLSNLKLRTFRPTPVGVDGGCAPRPPHSKRPRDASAPPSTVSAASTEMCFYISGPLHSALHVALPPTPAALPSAVPVDV